MKTQAQTIIITGFMGAGKTTIATALARKLSCPMIDLDRFIAEREGRTAQVIIDEDGEECFREIESRALRDAIQSEHVGIVALGGGAWTVAHNRALVEEHDCFTVWLHAPFELCWRRIEGEGKERPLGRDLAAASELYLKRRTTYDQAMLRIEISEAKSAATVASEIADALP